MAERSGAISPGDFDLEQVKTNSAEICPVIHPQGRKVIKIRCQA
jgi:hypothetical protein